MGEVKEAREDIIQDKVEAMEVKEVTTQEAAATKVGKEVTTLVTMAVVVREDKEGTIQVGMATKEEARVVTIPEEMVTTVEMGGVVTILADLWMMRGTLEKRPIGRLSVQLSELLPSLWLLCWWSEVFAWPREDTEGCPSPICRKSAFQNISCPMFEKKLIIHPKH